MGLKNAEQCPSVLIKKDLIKPIVKLTIVYKETKELIAIIAKKVFKQLKKTILYDCWCFGISTPPH